MFRYFSFQTSREGSCTMDLTNILSNWIETIMTEMNNTVEVNFVNVRSKGERKLSCSREHKSLLVYVPKIALLLSGNPSVERIPMNYTLLIKEIYLSTGTGLLDKKSEDNFFFSAEGLEDTTEIFKQV